MSKKPPKWPLKFFRWFCRPDYAEDIEGDLLERFEKRPSNWRFTREVIRLFRPGIIRNFELTTKIVSIDMLVYFLKIGLRNLKRPNTFSVVNFLSFSVALSASFLIYKYVDSAYGADSFFSQKENIYRLVRKVDDPNASYRSPSLAAPYKDDFVNNYGIEEGHIARLFTDDELVTYQGKSFFEDNFFYSDPSFLTILDFPLSSGDHQTALKKANSVVISQRAAKKYFGTKNPLGEIIEIDNKGLLEVSGVFDDIPARSHLEIDFLAPMTALGYASRLLKDKEAHAFSFYFRRENLDLPEHITGIEENTTLSYQPLSEIYFDNSLELDEAEHENENLLKSLIFIAILILIIAGANFLNLILSSSLRKVKDLGVRKVLGSNWKLEVLKQLIETYLIVFAAFTVAIGVCFLASEMINTDIIVFTIDASLLYMIPLLALILTLSFALFPSLIPSTVKASSAMERKIKNIKVGFLQESILTTQFLISMLLILLSVVVTKQFNYMQNRELGLNPDQILYFTSNNKHSYRNLSKIKSEVEALTGVKEVATSIGGLPTSYTETLSYRIEGVETTRQLMTAFTSLNFPNLLDLEAIEGTPFDIELTSETGKTALLNETAARQLGWPQKDIIGTSIEPLDYFGFEEGQTRKVVGIVKDFHFDSFKNAIEPLAILSSDLEETIIVKLASEDSKNTVLAIASVWDKYVPKYPFEYSFLDQKFQRMHAEDTKQRNLLYLFSGLAIIISIAGLLSLSSYLLQIRKKEIVLRSVLGATSRNLLKLLAANYLKLLLVAGILVVPVAMLLSTRWLNEFSYRINLSPDILFTGISSVVLVMLFILSIQILHSIKLNPAEELSNE